MSEAIYLPCKCGKQLRAREDYRGHKVRCPSCGRVVLVPGGDELPRDAAPVRRDRPSRSAVAQASPEPSRPPHQSKPPRPETVVEEEPRDRDRRPKRKKKKKVVPDGPRRGFMEVDVLGFHMTLRKWLAAACVLALLGTLLYFLIPRYNAQVVEALRADIYAALEVKNPGAENVLNVRDKEVIRTGSDMFLIVHENQKGEQILMRLALPPKYIEKMQNSGKLHATAGDLQLSNNLFTLKGEGQTVEALLVEIDENWQYVKDDEKSVTVDFSRCPLPDPVIPRDRSPWTPEGDFERNYEVFDPKKTDILDQVKDMKTPAALSLAPEEAGVAITGTGAFKGKRGLEVNYKFNGSSAEVSWDRKSKAYFGTTFQTRLNNALYSNQNLLLVFPRPKGKEITLFIAGEAVGTINPR